MQQQAIDVASEAMEKYTVEKDIAQHIKKEFDVRAGATWHCIVGRNFGSFVTHGEWILHRLHEFRKRLTLDGQKQNISYTSTSVTAPYCYSKHNDWSYARIREVFGEYMAVKALSYSDSSFQAS